MLVRGWWLSLLVLAACEPAEIRIRGRVERARVRPDTYFPLADGTVTIHDREGVEFASTVTDADGRFVTRGPVGQIVFATVEGEGLATSSFTGITGAPNTGDLVVALDEHQDSPLYGVLTSQVDELRARYAGCPGADGAGGIVFGDVRVIGITDPVTDEEPLVTTAEVRVNNDDDVEIPACYLDADGVAWDPDAVETGDAGQFAIFGVPPGLWTLRVAYASFVESDEETFSSLFVPDAESPVVPRQPAWVEFPF